MTMVGEIENHNEHKNYVELPEDQLIFKKVKEELDSVQDKLLEKSETKITINEAKSELKKINEWLQWTNLENKDKKEIWKAFEKLIKLEKNIDENTLKNEVDEIIKLVENLTQKDLANLQGDVKKNKRHQKRWQRSNPKRPADVQKWIDESDKNFRDHFAYAAKHEPNTPARIAATVIDYILKDDLA